MFQAGNLLVHQVLDKHNPTLCCDLKHILPLGELLLQGCTGEASLDGEDYVPLTSRNAKDTSARFVRFALLEGEGRGEVRLHCGSGFYAQEEPYWTDAFCRKEKGRGWRGGDGVYSLLLQDDAAASRRKILFTFGDTLISDINPDGSRIEPLDMVNNTYAILTGQDALAPGGLRFCIARDEKGRDSSLIEPAPGAFDYQGAGLKVNQTYYWMQDWALSQGHLLTFPMLLTEDKTQPEGYQFRLLGTILARIPLLDGEPDFSRSQQFPLNLYLKEAGREILYGGCVLRKNGKTVCDAYIYLYGYMTTEEGRFLCLARVREEEVADRSQWTFFDGKAFVPDIAASAPLLSHVSTELSVSYLAHGPLRGKYLVVFQYNTNSRYVAVSVADSPTGPFSPARKVYDCPESGAGRGSYTYNAKLHEPLSSGDRLIASYNVNTTSWQEHVDQALLYRPRFLRLRHTGEDEWDRLFSNAFDQRLEMFRWLNQTAQAGAAVFAGDSLIQEFPLEEFFPGSLVYNRGIGGDTTFGLLQRLQQSVVDLQPSKVFLLAGANDLEAGKQPGDIVERILEAVRRIRDSLPACSIHVITLLPVNKSDHPKINQLVVHNKDNVRIEKVNLLLQEAADKEPFALVDAHGALLDENGQMKLHCTQEGLHLSPEGYAVLAGLLRPLL